MFASHLSTSFPHTAECAAAARKVAVVRPFQSQAAGTLADRSIYLRQVYIGAGPRKLYKRLRKGPAELCLGEATIYSSI
jgi:hypothetical protein